MSQSAGASTPAASTDTTPSSLPAAPGFPKQPLNGLLGLFVFALAKVMLANAAPRVDEVERRPILVLEGAPDGVVVVDHDRVVDPHLPHRPTDVVDVLFEWELGGVHADDDEASRYFCAQARTYGSVRSQLMQV